MAKFEELSALMRRGREGRDIVDEGEEVSNFKAEDMAGFEELDGRLAERSFRKSLVIL